MKFVERIVQEIGDWEALEDLDARNTQIEAKYGFPAKRRMRAFSGPYSMNTLILEREWESLAAMETAFEKILADPEYQDAGNDDDSIVVSSTWELYLAM